MEDKDKIMVEKIKNVLANAYKQGINPLFTASYIQGDPKGVNKTIMGKLKKLMMENNITIQQVKEFINKKDFDIFNLINQVEQENEYITVYEEEIDMDENLFKENIAEELEPEKDDDIEIIDLNEERPELSEKAKKLQEKVDLLCEKVEEEKSPFKRHILTFQIKMLVSKIQREIDLQNIKDKYELKRERLEDRKQRKEDRLIDKIADLDADIRQLDKIIKGNEEYDYKSKNFLYPKQYVETSGGIDKFTDKLKQSKQESTQKVANRIEMMTQARQELDNLKEQLKVEKQKLQDAEYNHKMEITDINIEEKSLIIANKVNIFSRIGTFFGTMFEEAKNYWQEKQELKQLDIQQKQEMKEIEEETKRIIQEVKREQAAKKQEKVAQQKAQKEDVVINKSKDTAANFRSSQFVPTEKRIEEESQQPEIIVQEVEQAEPEGQEPGE